MRETDRLLDRRSGFDESEKVGIDHFRIRRAHAVRETRVCLEGASLEELR